MEEAKVWKNDTDVGGEVGWLVGWLVLSKKWSVNLGKESDLLFFNVVKLVLLRIWVVQSVEGYP